MAKTEFTQADALTQIAWDEKLFRDTLKQIFWERFRGASDAMVYSKTDMMGTAKKGKKPATRVVFGLRMRLTGDGVEDGETLEGNEESLTTHDFTLSLKQYRHAVRDAGSLDRMRPAFQMDPESRMAISDWGAEKQDLLHFNAIQSSPTRVISPQTTVPYTGAGSFAAAKLALEAGDKIGPEYLSKFRVYCKTGGARDIIPIRPVKIPGFGKALYVFIAHPDAVYDFVQDSKVQQNLRDALVRSKDHPLFLGAVGYTNDGVIIYEHENMNIGTDAGAGTNVDYSQAAMMGQQALVHAFGKRPQTVSKTFDYDNEHGHAWGVIMRVEKPVFDSEDYGSIGAIVSRTSISDAA